MKNMKKSTSKLPPGVYKDRSRYAYKQYLGRIDGKRKYARPIRLAPLDAPLSEVWKQYEKVTGQVTDNLRWLLDTYHKSDKFQSLAPATQGHQEIYRRKLINKQLQNGNLFGDVQLNQITRRVIQRYLDKSEAKVAANRHIQYLKSAWNWAINRYENVPEINPCIGVELNREQPRDKYVTPEEYLKVYQAALSARTPYFAYALELAYLCRARRSEIFNFKYSDISETGLLLNRGKGSKSEIILWSDRLRAAVEGCKTINPNAPRPISGGLLLHNKQGKPFARGTLDSTWRKLMIDAGLKGQFTFHDIKACGCTDADFENAGGHKSKKMAAIYDRLPGKKEATK